MDGDIDISRVKSALIQEARNVLSNAKPCGVSPIGVCTTKCLEYNRCRKNPYKQEKKGKKS